MSSLLKRALPAATALLALAPAAVTAETVAIDPVRVAKTLEFEIGGVEPRQVMSGRVVHNGRSRVLKRSILQKAARVGRLKIDRAALRARTARRSSLRETKLVLFVDTLPPTPPASVSVQAARHAVVKWARGKDDYRLAGYQVFRGEKRLTTTSKTRFTDSLGGDGDYKVRSVDAAGNVSAFSMPPVPPLPTSGGGPSWKCGWGTFDIDRLPGDCWRPFADDSFLNTPLPPGARLLQGSVSASKRIVNRILRMGKVPQMPVNPIPGEDWFHAYFFSRPSDPLYRVVCNKPGNPVDCPIEGMKLRIPAQARGADSADGHMSVIDQSTGWEWDFWNVQTDKLPPNGGDIVVGWGGRTRMDGAGGGTRETESPATMASLGSTAGIIRYPELAAGRIDHALFIGVGCSSGKRVFPGRDVGGFCDQDISSAPASGQWLRLNMTEAEIGALPVSSWQKAILTALARYGGFVGDTGSGQSVGFQIDSPATYTAIGKENPWLGFAKERVAAGDDSVDTWKDYDGIRRYGLDVGRNSQLWLPRLEVVDPCVIERTC